MASTKNTTRFQSLSTRLSLWIISLGTIIFIIVLSTNYFLSRFLLDEYVEALAKTTASSTEHRISTIFNAVATSANSLASVVSTPDITDKQIHQNIKAFINNNASIFGMTVALEPHTLIHTIGDYSPYYYRTENTLTYSDLAEKSYNYQTWSWYSDPKERNASLWSEPYFDEGGGKTLMITYSTPIYQPNRTTFAGIATADIQLQWLDDIIRELNIGDNGFGFILSRDNVVIAHSNKVLTLTQLNKNNVHPEKWEKYIDSKSKEAAAHFTSSCTKDSSKGNCRFAIKTLGNTGWKIVIALPETELRSKIEALTIKIAIIALIGLVLLFIVISSISRRLTQPLNKLASATKEIGAGNLDTDLPESTRNDEIGALTDDFSSMRQSLKTYIAEIKETTAKQQKLDSEIQIATDIQMSMIPGAGHVSLKLDSHQIFALLRPARSVGGDLYYYQQTDNILHFIIGDVSDKGIPAALFMAKTITLYTQALRDQLSPGETFTMMNGLLAQNNDACMFVTALCGSINLNSGAVIMANAGHMNPIKQETNHCGEHDVSGATALGLMECIDYPNVNFQLGHNTSLIMYTDGISEAHDTENNQYTDERLIELTSKTNPDDAEKEGNIIMDSVDEFAAGTEQFDDITLLIIRYE
jgi:sigma-B regulation protein RsbU (phosphoserine phosphatase)